MTDTPDALETRARRVVFFEDRAQVHRHATASLEAGTHTLVLRGVTPLIDDPSLVVELEPSGDTARVLTARVRRHMRTEREGSEAEIAALEQRVVRAERALERAQRDRHNAERALERTASLERALLEQLTGAPLTDAGPPEQWADSIDSLGQAQHEDLEATLEHLEAIDQAQRERDRAQALLAQARRTTQDVEARVEVQVRLEQPAELDLELRYFTPCALWRPSHRARLRRDDEQGPRLIIETLATLWQATGERWDQIECAFSTARPSQAARPPTLSDDHLSARPKTDRERRVVDVEARDVSLETTGPEGRRGVSEMPGVDDGGEPLTLEATRPVSPTSNGRPFQVPLETIELPCEVETRAYPELSRTAHLCARATWSHAHPAAGRPRDPAARVRARRLRPHHDGPARGALRAGLWPREQPAHPTRARDRGRLQLLLPESQAPARAHRHPLPVEPERGARALTLTERLPVSEIEQVSVELTEAPASARPDADGMLTLHIELDPHETTRQQIVYRVEHAHNVNLSW